MNRFLGMSAYRIKGRRKCLMEDQKNWCGVIPSKGCGTDFLPCLTSIAPPDEAVHFREFFFKEPTVAKVALDLEKHSIYLPSCLTQIFLTVFRCMTHCFLLENATDLLSRSNRNLRCLTVHESTFFRMSICRVHNVCLIKHEKKSHSDVQVSSVRLSSLE